MKKTIAHLLLAALLVWGCASTTPPGPSQPDEENYNKGVRLMELSSYDEAITAFEDLRDKFPLSHYASVALLHIGECHYLQKNYIEAQFSFDTFRRLYPGHARVDYSMFMSGMCQFNQILDYDRDQTSARAAVRQFEMLREAFPDSPYAGRALCKIAEAKKHIAEYEFFVGSFYLKKNDYRAAYARFDRLLLQYPNAIERDRVLLSMAKACLYDGQVEKGRRILQLLLMNYPDGAFAADATTLLNLY
jgi:outer membrane protein assembly factor BamD